MKGFRGVTEGTVRLFPLTVFCAPNNSGKSTFLEALAVATQGLPALHELVIRRGWNGFDSLDALLPRDKATISTVSPPTALVSSQSGNGETVRNVTLSRVRVLDKEDFAVASVAAMTDPQAIDVVGNDHPGRLFIDVHGNKQGVFKRRVERSPTGPRVVDHLLTPERILESAAAVERKGARARDALVAHLRAIDPHIRDVRALPSDKSWTPHAIYDEATVPLSSLGDGTKRLFVLAAELALSDSGMTLLEEPECFQHEAVFQTVARLVWDAVDRGVQVVLSTHSTSLIRTIRDAAGGADNRRNMLGLVELRRDAEGQVTAVAHPDARGAFLDERLRERLSGTSA